MNGRSDAVLRFEVVLEDLFFLKPNLQNLTLFSLIWIKLPFRCATFVPSSVHERKNTTWMRKACFQVIKKKTTGHDTACNGLCTPMNTVPIVFLWQVHILKDRKQSEYSKTIHQTNSSLSRSVAYVHLFIIGYSRCQPDLRAASHRM